MLYWLGVYMLVVITVAVPVLLLYSIVWLIVAVIRFMTRSWRAATAVRTVVSKAQPNVIRHRAA
jgi:hypothetical protein